MFLILTPRRRKLLLAACNTLAERAYEGAAEITDSDDWLDHQDADEMLDEAAQYENLAKRFRS